MAVYPRPTLDRRTAERAHLIALRQARAAHFRGPDAQDVAAAAVTKAIAAWPEFVEDGEGSLERWISTIALNIIRDRRRRERTARVHAVHLVDTQVETQVAARPLAPDTVAINVGVRRARLKLYDSLPEQLCAVVRLVAQATAGEISRGDAASALGLNVHSYDKVVQKVKAALRKAVTEKEVDLAELHELGEAEERRGK